MNCIYIYDGHFEKGEAGWPLIKGAAARYAGELGLNLEGVGEAFGGGAESLEGVEEAFGGVEICRTDKGKPFFPDLPIEFSLSHSGMMWMCMFSQSPCGLDLQIVEEHRDYDNIARKRFTKEEQHYVGLWGREGFYEIWVRKEAFGKCTGQGIFSPMPSMVDEHADLKSLLEWDNLTYYMTSLDISPEMKCAYCTMEEGQTELRILG